MKQLLQILFLYCLIPLSIMGQFSDNFSDGDLNNNPSWQGDVNMFRVNELNELQLDADEAGTASIFLPYTLISDFSWQVDLEMDFSPSNNNNLKIYFMVDQLDLSIANGYFIQIGENLADDALRIFRIDNGVETELASGEMGALASDPALLSLKMERVEGLWTIFTDYTKQGILSEELQFFDDTYDFVENAFFIIEPKYTSSNTKKFYFDNILGDAFMPDVTGPQFVMGSVIDNRDIVLQFNEEIEETSLSALEINGDEDNEFISAEIDGDLSNMVLLRYQNQWGSGVEYDLSIMGLADREGNVMDATSFRFFLTEKPQNGDLVINEVLFDPPVEGKDFIEIKNISDKYLDLGGVILWNDTKEGSEEVISSGLLLKPEEMVAICSDTSILVEDYSPPSSAQLYENKIPALNKDEGNVSLLNEAGEILDAFDYHEDFHLSFIDDTKGVSLERIFPNGPSSQENFASGVANTGFATPGYENANFRQESMANQGVLNVENTVFSPNEDGMDDQLVVLLNMPDISYLSTLRVYNINGQLIKTIHSNKLTAINDIAQWDGSKDDGGKASIGHYILTLEAFNQQGDVIRARSHIKLLDFF